MGKINNSQYAILGHLIEKGSLSGYDIKKLSLKSTGHFWQESMGHLYPTLKKILLQKFIIEVGNDAKELGRERRVYKITQKGKEHFDNWLKDKTVESGVRNVLLLKLFFSSDYSLKNAMTLLRKEIVKIEHKLEQVKDIESFLIKSSSNSNKFDYWLITIDYGLMMLRAKLTWAKRSLSRLKKKEI